MQSSRRILNANKHLTYIFSIIQVVLVGDTEGDVSVYLLSNLPIIPSSHVRMNLGVCVCVCVCGVGGGGSHCYCRTEVSIREVWLILRLPFV